MSTFTELGLKEVIQRALTDLGYKSPTEIQKIAIPQIIGSTRDVKAFAQTGTGKTAAFSLPILEQIDLSSKDTQALILSPTRELAVQIGENIREFAKHIKGFNVVTVYGGANAEDQIRKLRRGAHIVVGTPGRTVDLINRRALKPQNLRWLVLDEADEMLNMGFKDELDKILNETPKEKQTLLFSATFPREVDAIARNYMNNPVDIKAGTVNTGSDSVSHEYYMVTERNRYAALKRISDANPEIYGVIFCRTKRETNEISEKLIQDGYSVDAIHGDLSQAQRDNVMQKFKKKSIQLLCATDVAARGIDVKNLTHVINYKLPDQIEAYTHRSGRTGRAGAKGISISIVTRKELNKIRPIEKRISKKFTKKEVPDGVEICKSQLFKMIGKVENVEVNETELSKYTETIFEKLAHMDREELIKRFVSLEFNSFLEYYSKSRDLNEADSGRDSRDSGRSSSNENMTRFFINIGRKDSLDPKSLIGLINDNTQTSGIEIGSIDILDTFSFFEIDKNYEQEALDSIIGADFNGRNVNLEVTKAKRGGGGGGGRGRGGSRGGSSDRGGYRGGSSDRRGGGNRDGGSRDGGGSRRRFSSNSSSSSSSQGRRRTSGGSGFGRKRESKG
ncbi:MAG: DEAD/DEAH box helicase [Flavobacteriaceae bacterium]|nr:DEAD/DEAH box helicase [Flavobacteriaceae bacterium]